MKLKTYLLSSSAIAAFFIGLGSGEMTHANQVNKTEIKPLEKMVVTTKNGRLYQNSNLENYKTVKSGVAYKVDGYRIIDGKRYYQVYRSRYCGYIEANQVSDLKKQATKGMYTATSNNYKRYSNLFWKERGTTTKGTVYEVDGYYRLGDQRYYSLYRYNSQGKRGWYGYVNAKSLKALNMTKKTQYVTVNNDHYKRYSNFFWKERGAAKRGTIYQSPGYYMTGNGDKYYSLYRQNSKGQRGWYGYINAKAMKTASWHNMRLSFTVKNDRYKGYKNPYLNQTLKGTAGLKGKTVTTSCYFDNGIGTRYYSLYNGKTKLGLVNQKAMDSNYFLHKPNIIKIKQATGLYSDSARTKKKGTAPKGEFYKVDKLVTSDKHYPVLKLANGQYITAHCRYVAKTKGYQNPKQYYQVQYSQIKPYGTVGYNLGWGYMGVKTYMVCKKLGIYNGYNFMGDAQINAVKNFQRRHGLKATGWVDKKTWTTLGFSASSWTSIDSYVAPLKAFAWDNRQKHIEAMINQAYKYLGNKYLEGASSSPSYGVDCSGLVMQGLYAGGINPAPISSINHASPGNEYNSRNLWASPKLKRVPFNQRQRGDLIFYYQPGTHTIWHVAIYLGNDKVIESWPPKVVVWPIRNAQRNVIAGVKRPFI